MDHHIETALFGFGGTTKTLPELKIEINKAHAKLLEALDELISYRDRKETDHSYYYKGKDYIKTINGYRDRISNRVDKIAISYNKEANKYHAERRALHDKKFTNPSELDARAESKRTDSPPPIPRRMGRV